MKMTSFVRTNEIAKAAPTRSRPDDVSAEYAQSLEAELRKRVEGEVRFDNGSRALYSTDASNYRQVPIGVVVPKTTEDVVATVKLAREHGAPILARVAVQAWQANVVTSPLSWIFQNT